MMKVTDNDNKTVVKQALEYFENITFERHTTPKIILKKLDTDPEKVVSVIRNWLHEL